MRTLQFFLIGLVLCLACVETSAQRFQVTTLPINDDLTCWGRLGGITVDRLGFIYVSNFGEGVWKITPDGSMNKLTSSLYGSSGNAIDQDGNLLQADLFSNSIFKINRNGEMKKWFGEGLKGPVGLVVENDGSVLVCNCNNNSISRISTNKVLTTLVSGDLFACPNGITIARNDIYVVNFSNDDIIKISKNTAKKFTTVATGGGNSHIVYWKDKLYVTKIKTNEIYEVGLDGSAKRIVGNGQKGLMDGPGDKATLAHPNGITSFGNSLLVNNIDGEWRKLEESKMVIRKITINE